MVEGVRREAIVGIGHNPRQHTCTLLRCRGEQATCTALMKFVGCVGLIMLVSVVGAQRMYFIGYLEAHSIQMDLTIDDLEIKGYYFYDLHGQRLNLQGSRYGNTLELREIPANSKENTQASNGTLRLEWIESQQPGASPQVQLKGFWQGLGRGQRHEVAVELERIAIYAHWHYTQDERLEVHATYPIFMFEPHLSVTEKYQPLLLNGLMGFIFDGQNALRESLWSVWRDTMTFNIAYVGERIICLVEEGFAYTGGSHNMPYKRPQNYHLTPQGAAPITLVQMLLPDVDPLAQLTPYLLQQLKEQGASNVLNGSVTSFTLEDLSNPIVTPLGFTFVFEPYHLGSFKEGMFEVTVPLTMMHTLLKPEFRLSHAQFQQRTSQGQVTSNER